ncbi:MAG TPA: DUF1127 domain-containing protein [Stellaceae bacterium]|nr:DUF1127 domain-containing protein [Stellaceae bacterium]
MSSSFEANSNVVVLALPRRAETVRETEPAHVAPDLRAPEKSLWSVFCAYYTRARDRRYLEALDDHALRDIGLSRDQIGRPFWEPLDRA